MNPHQEQVDFLFAAELQFRLASAVRLAASAGAQPFDLPQVWSHGTYRVGYQEVALRPDQGDFAAWSLQRSATYMLAMAAKDAIRAAVQDPRNAGDSQVRAAYQISRMIRNSFAHAPFHPRWSIDADCKDQVFEVSGVVRLDTTGLNGELFDWRHYGGPLALLRLSMFVRHEMLGDPRSNRTVIPMPRDIYLQQGDLVLRAVEPGESA